jgi:ketosteroid isomerase-like protein
MRIRIIFITLLSFSLLLCSCIKRREIKVESDKVIVDKIIREYVSSLDSADTDRLLSLYAKSPDIVVIGTGEEFYIGYDQVEKFYKEFKLTLARWNKRHFSLTRVETKLIDGIAWFSSRLDLSFEHKVKSKGKTKVKLIEKKIRFTGVLIKEEGNWKLVQSHMSLPSL